LASTSSVQSSNQTQTNARSEHQSDVSAVDPVKDNTPPHQNFCSFCGEPLLNKEAKFCAHCGTNV